MNWKYLFVKKDLETLLAEMAGEHRLHRALGPVALTTIGVGCIIGAGIFVVTGKAAALDAGPAVSVSYAVCAVSCILAALCYAEFAAMAPVAGSAYTYAYTTLGEIFAWMIGWDLILEYAMACATVASAWSNYLNKFLLAISGDRLQIPKQLLFDPFTPVEGLAGHPWLSLPSVCITLAIMAILILGIRESARTNAVLLGIKLSVVLLVIGVGCAYIKPANWTSIPYAERSLPEEFAARDFARKHLLEQNSGTEPSAEQVDGLTKQLRAEYRVGWIKQETERLQKAGRLSADEGQSMVEKTLARVDANLPRTDEDRQTVDKLLPKMRDEAVATATKSWGILALFGIDRWLQPIDDSLRGPFMPYGLSGIMLGAAIVFFAYIGFDSISTHAEEAKNPARDMPIAILASLAVCTVLYMAVTAVITGMVPYPNIDIHAPIAAAFADKAEEENSTLLRIATSLIAAGGLAGMTSVLLVMLQSQARIFMAMSRDGLLPKVFSAVHPRFRTPHLSTLITGSAICVVAAFTPIQKLEEMVNIGTLMAFAIVCAAVLLLRFQRPDAKRPFRCPLITVVAPLGVLVNFTMMLFLPVDTWLRLVVWLVIGLMIYFAYSHRHSHLVQNLVHEIQAPGAVDQDYETPE
jgi:amino acid transporter